MCVYVFFILSKLHFEMLVEICPRIKIIGYSFLICTNLSKDELERTKIIIAGFTNITSF